MNGLRFASYGLFASVLVLAACGSAGPKFDKKNPPAGGTRAELVYQMATRLADQGYCATAMPVFVCLAGQGPGWEVAAQRAGQCAPIAARLWQEDDLDKAHTADSEENKQHKTTLKLQQPFAWQSSPKAILAEGLRQLRRAANANWPEAQAELAVQLYSAGGKDLAEARHWMEQYDKNARRKIYGGNEIPVDIRKALKTVPRSGAGGSQWFPVEFLAEPSRNHDCDRLLGKRPLKQHSDLPAPRQVQEIDDGLEKTEPKPHKTTAPQNGENHGGH